tara:strand:+ start:1999 stop:2511 length:513 start_codon:yes stop_codon:yes gene_type:complete
MARYGSERDISLFRHLNRELMGDIITQQCAIYKFKLDETKVNIYGEAAGEKYYMGPVLFNCLVERRDQEYPETDLGTDFNWGANFKFLRDDLVDSDVVPEVGDIILYEEGYYEVDSIITNQYYMGKNPDYPNSPNPLNPDLDKFGYNVSIICQTHYVPADKVGITRERLI